ncbi:aminotransferase class I/II-fold pyridoxal phosphate-dependent enzyme [Paenarthrobacter nitroguajacolicus]|uniref:cysteine-S-conjugate beta-lyase n=1 Tax=Paenarthrobacter nitroguajacolicus TaxID=211146 RepID=A0A558HCI9_PAENT|nr:aminotransferase class I/II-fold pyridoxal phosphate-dependent enzyme [Paenarthrobacter nitroguajacolicus]TVU66845.1 aminotransferase class I/II-fold pyridoxal phosphate-dependent enzyme [Paenarthrobacter nitroguajacolicus]
MSTGQFDTINRERLRGGYGVKWGALQSDVLASWVADMDFGTPPAVREAIQEVVERHDLGYPFWPGEDPVIEAFEARMSSHHHWTPTPGRTRIYTDLIQVLQVMIEHSTSPGDGIAIHVPTYPPFLAAIERSGRRIIPIPMIETGGKWRFDTEGLTDQLRRENCRMLVLVNPQNPTGRVFNGEELASLAHTSEELDLVVFSDEIHADLTYDDHRHIPFASLGKDAADRTITATSATKAFNIAGMRCAVAHIGPQAVWDALESEPLDYFGQPSILSRVATVAAWTQSEPWLVELKATLSANRRIIKLWTQDLPYEVRSHEPDATYLSWLDFSDAGLDLHDPAADLERRARVRLSQGAEFSQHTSLDTTTFARINFATSTSNLLDILGRIRCATTRAAARNWTENNCIF